MHLPLGRPPHKPYFNPNLGIAYSNPRLSGIEFENQVHSVISSYLSVKNILRERDIINQFGQTCTAIDHMFDDPNSSTRFCIQSKWRNSKESLDYTHHFIKCVETVQKASTGSICRVQGIMLSKQPITARSKAAFEAENLSNPNIKFINIHADLNTNPDPNPVEAQAQAELIDRLLEHLHLIHQIWAWDSDGSIIMR